MGGGNLSTAIPSLMSQTPIPLLPPRSMHAYATPPGQQYLPPAPLPTSLRLQFIESKDLQGVILAT